MHGHMKLHARASDPQRDTSDDDKGILKKTLAQAGRADP
jgi:hypothetical protein